MVLALWLCVLSPSMDFSEVDLFGDNKEEDSRQSSSSGASSSPSGSSSSSRSGSSSNGGSSSSSGESRSSSGGGGGAAGGGVDEEENGDEAEIDSRSRGHVNDQREEYEYEEEEVDEDRDLFGPDNEDYVKTPATSNYRWLAVAAAALFTPNFSLNFFSQISLCPSFRLTMENGNPNSSESCAPSFVKISHLNCIDLSSPDIGRSVSLLKQACLDCGFFYVINHGIGDEFMNEVFDQSKRFFSLPMSEKMDLLRNEKHRGYTPILDELLDPENQVNVIGDYKEGYYIGVEVPEDDPKCQKPFYGPNIWPGADILPGWRQTMEKYHQEALRVAREVARIIALALDLEADFFDKPEMLGEAIGVLRLLHYGGQVSDPSKGIYGAGAHSDYGLITLLATDDIMGLQICKDKDAKPQVWEYVAPLKGSFVVNLGDMLERWSNCVFKSTLHRVLGNDQERYSIAFFVEPSHECIVECLPTCHSELNPPKFPPIECATYLSQRYKDTHADLDTYNKP